MVEYKAAIHRRGRDLNVLIPVPANNADRKFADLKKACVPLLQAGAILY